MKVVFVVFACLILSAVADYDFFQDDDSGESAYEIKKMDRLRRDNNYNPEVFRFDRHRRDKPYDPYAVLIQDSYIDYPRVIRKRRAGNYVVADGETCWSVAQKFKLEYNKVLKDNANCGPTLVAGETLII